MKKFNIFLFIILGCLITQYTYSQNIGDLKGIYYQAVAIDEEGKEIVGMDVEGKPLYEKAIGVRFTINKGVNGPVQWEETHTTTTDKYGLFSLTIGLGQLTASGTYNRLLDIPWIDADQFLKVEISTKNNGNYKLVSNQQFMAMPYSFYTDDIADNAITTEKILDRTILSEDISEGAVTTFEILNGTILNQDIADGTIDLTGKVTGILPVANGGTGLSGSVVTDGQLLIGNGTTGDYDLTNLTPGTGIQINNTAGGIQISSTIQAGGVNTQETGVENIGDIDATKSFVTQVPLQGVAPGDFVVASYSKPLEGCLISGYVRNINEIEVVIYNANDTTVNLGEGTFKVLVIK